MAQLEFLTSDGRVILTRLLEQNELLPDSGDVATIDGASYDVNNRDFQYYGSTLTKVSVILA